jgi:hypothetical protein
MYQICMYQFVLVLVQIDLIQFEFSTCIRSICIKTNTDLLHTNSIHSTSRKKWMILHKIGQVIQIVVHQFVRKMSANKKIPRSEKNDPPLSSGTCEYVESILSRKKSIPYKPYVRKKNT